MRRSIMKKGSLSLSPPPPPLLLFVILLSLFSECFSEEFFCHYGGGLQFTGDKREIGGWDDTNKQSSARNRLCRRNICGAIIPRGDINVKVGEDNEKVYCRFNSTFINSEDVYFATRNTILPSQILNETTILTEIAHSGPDKYELLCKLKKKKKGDKTLCSQIVKAGYPPLDVKNFSCISENNINVNCSWTKPQNPILTMYYSNYTIPNYKGITPCPESNVPSATYCFWNKSNRIPLLRPEFDLTITGINEFGTRNYTYRIYIPKIVVPEKISAEVSLIGPVRAKVSWNLTYPMDVFHYGLWHSVEYRVKDENQWENVTFFFHKKNLLTLNPNRTFSVEVSLPFSDAEYEFRVRIHTGIGEIREDMWSGYDIFTVKTEPLAPRVAPETSMSSFEVEEGLEKRNIFVNFKDFNDKRLEGGKDFHYIASVYSLDDAKEIDVSPVEVTRAYIKYKNMNFTEYNFRIIPANEMGSGNTFSEVTVPNSDCMPKKTEMFTVITSTSYQGKMFSLYWVPSRMPSGHCEGLSINIESYTIFWCKRTSGNRCKEKMDWMEIKTEDLSVKDLSSLTSADIVIFEKNVTHLREDQLYSFGVAANSGNYSSGIKWSSCIVDDTEPPLPPVTEVEALTNDSGTVLVKWNLKCMSISAVPVGFNISYCKSTVEDFGHCTSEVHFEEMNSPTSSEVLISGLDAGNSYIFSVSVLSIIGEGIQSYPKIIKLREDIPAGPPKELKATLVTNSTVELRWNPPTKLERRGIVTHYKISVVPPVRENIVVPSVSEEDAVTYTLKNLHPFTKYKIFISSCNAKGCSVSNQAELSFDTEPGVPNNVENFNLDVSNWRLMWDLKHCNSRFCSFDIQLPVNETVNKTVTVDDKETLSLHEENIMCNYTKMKFGIRAKGQDKEGNFLYGNWTYASKDASDCPSEVLSWWVICIIVFFCALLTAIVLLIMKFGWRTIMKTIKDCKQRINVPKGIQATEQTKEPLKDFSTFPQKNSFSSRDSDPPLLMPSTPPRTLSEERATKIRADSVSSEEVQLIDSSSDHDRHGRNLSGSSDRSSGNDSAMMSGCPSLNQTDPMDNLPSELSTSSSQETTLRQRSPGPPYVQHGIIPEKLSEGYVTAWSVPSLPHLYKEGLDSMQQSTPDLKESMCVVGWQNARRASTGYISMPDSDTDKESPLRGVRDSFGEISLARMPQIPSGVNTCLPHYSRHSFNPEVKVESAKGGYVVLAEGRSPSPPDSGSNVGYVSAGDPFGLKRPPSLPLIPKSFSVGESDLPLGAYVRVGSRGNSASKGYVSAGHHGGFIPPNENISEGNKSTPYVSCGEAASIVFNANNPPNECPPVPFSPYVEIKDGGRWAHPINPRPHFLTSAPVEGSRAGRVGPLPRPNTTEATIGHQRGDRNPSLSKQSSGYVSQETITNPEGVLMSPKRLLTQSTAPHNIVMATNHQASMV